MKKREAENKIREIIRKHGFEVETDMRNALPGVKRTDAAVISFIIQEHPDFGSFRPEEKTVNANVEISASICRMGGSPTAEELLEAADQIRRGAELVADLQSMNLSYTIEF